MSKKMIASIVAVVLGVAAAVFQIDFRGAFCGGENAPAAEQSQ